MDKKFHCSKKNVCGCCFAGWLFSLFGSSGFVMAIWTVHWSCVSSTFAAPSAKMDNVTALINELTDMQQTWRKPRGAGRKKRLKGDA